MINKLFQSQTACFSGHRPNGLGGYDESNYLNQYVKDQLKINIENLIVNKNIKYFISGGALGVDTWAAEIVLELKKKYQIKLFIAQPFLNQSSKWSKDQVNRYNKILQEADKVTTVSSGEFSSEKMKIRNKFMVDNSNYLIVVFNGDFKSGTGNLLKYARTQKKQIYLINMINFKTGADYAK